ncbi:hypothetical protein QL285_094089 [Trifolium repens]|nr:hypothetical protein QL285_094089 [Trifolium repens]
MFVLVRCCAAGVGSGIVGTLFESLKVFKSVEICRSLYLDEPYCVGVDCLEAVCELRLIYLGCRSIVKFDSMSCFLDSDGSITFDSRSGVSI